jgi:glycosyltransferase involved in cell wall biosynthesis
MKIALLAPLWEEVPPVKYGGTELVVANLAKGLTDLGHEVTTFACAGSAVKGELVPVIPETMFKLLGGFDWNGIKPYELLTFFELGKRAGEFDIIHNHVGFYPISVAPFLKLPIVTTFHFSEIERAYPYLVEKFREFPFISISMAQRQLAPRLNYVANIYHGIDVDSFKPDFNPKDGEFVFIGAVSEKKGIDIAIRCAKKLGVKLTIAGPVCEEERRFLDKEIFPGIDGKQIKFIGEVGHEQKNFLLANASALLFPSRWIEAFGLIMAESLACGTPVIALNNGAAAEVITHGKTGFVANSENEFIEFARQAGKISRRDCRAEAKQRFDLPRMATDHEKLYQDLAAEKQNHRL